MCRTNISRHRWSDYCTKHDKKKKTYEKKQKLYWMNGLLTKYLNTKKVNVTIIRLNTLSKVKYKNLTNYRSSSSWLLSISSFWVPCNGIFSVLSGASGFRLSKHPLWKAKTVLQWNRSNSYFVFLYWTYGIQANHNNDNDYKSNYYWCPVYPFRNFLCWFQLNNSGCSGLIWFMRIWSDFKSSLLIFYDSKTRYFQSWSIIFQYSF